MLAAAREI